MNFRAPLQDSARDRVTERELKQYPAHFSRRRPLLRRGMPYGPALVDGATEDNKPRGLIGQFFCASIESQYEHLMGQWADRVPLGSPDGGAARDPLIGAHEPDDGPFEIPREDPKSKQPVQPWRLRMRLGDEMPLTRTVGAAYLFYPGLKTLRGIAKSMLWSPDRRDSKTDTVDVEDDA
jgi:hypothetical protein